jgi:hypothetical protein
MGAFASLIILFHNFESTRTHTIMCVLNTILVLASNYVGIFNLEYVFENFMEVCISVGVQSLAVYLWFYN